MGRRIVRTNVNAFSGQVQAGPEINFSRHRVPASLYDDLLEDVSELLQNPGFFQSLPLVEPDKYRVRRYEFTPPPDESGVEHPAIPVVIKDTHAPMDDPYRHGLDWKLMRDIFKAHQDAVREGVITADTYDLRTPSSYGDLYDRFLLLEHVDGSSYTQTKDLFIAAGGGPVMESLVRANDDFHQNCTILLEKGIIPERPQSYHVIVAGQRPSNKKWVFFPAYDID
ncbi:MAG: hypothetical protein ABH851_01310 [Methanobacteriota archaeon]